MDRDGRRALAVLARLDLLQVAAILRGGLRDPVFVLALLGIAAAIAFGGAQLGLAARDAPREAATPVAAASFLAFGLAHAGFRAGPAAAIARGPFGELILRRDVRAAWLAARSGACLAPLVVLGAVGAVASAGLNAALWLSAGAIGGLILAAAAHFWAVRFSGARRRIRPISNTAAARTSWVVRRPVALIAWAHLRRRVGGVPMWLAIAGGWTVAGLAGALAHQNSGAAVGAAAASVLALPALALLSWTDVSLIQMLGREPVGLAALVGRFLGAAAVGAAGMFAVVLAAGLGVGPALGRAAGAGLGLGLFAVFLVLNALIRRRSIVAMAASFDFAASISLLFVTPWAALWTLVRLPVLLRAAAARRWLDA